jgi:hypothetical protein
MLIECTKKYKQLIKNIQTHFYDDYFEVIEEIFYKILDSNKVYYCSYYEIEPLGLLKDSLKIIDTYNCKNLYLIEFDDFEDYVIFSDEAQLFDLLTQIDSEINQEVKKAQEADNKKQKKTNINRANFLNKEIKKLQKELKELKDLEKIKK